MSSKYSKGCGGCGDCDGTNHPISCNYVLDEGADTSRINFRIGEIVGFRKVFDGTPKISDLKMWDGSQLLPYVQSTESQQAHTMVTDPLSIVPRLTKLKSVYTDGLYIRPLRINFDGQLDNIDKSKYSIWLFRKASRRNVDSSIAYGRTNWSKWAHLTHLNGTRYPSTEGDVYPSDYSKSRKAFFGGAQWMIDGSSNTPVLRNPIESEWLPFDSSTFLFNIADWFWPFDAHYGNFPIGGGSKNNKGNTSKVTLGIGLVRKMDKSEYNDGEYCWQHGIITEFTLQLGVKNDVVNKKTVRVPKDLGISFW